MLRIVKFYEKESKVCMMFKINIFFFILVNLNNFMDFYTCSSRLRDKYDELARIFIGYTDTARFNETLFNGLLNYSKSCTFLADSKDMEVQRLQLKVYIPIELTQLMVTVKQIIGKINFYY